MERIKSKTIYKIKFHLLSPLNIGTGTTVETDKDIIRNQDGVPYIPGSAIAGVCYNNLAIDEESKKKFFGDVKIARKANQDVESKSSKLLFFDANMTESSKSNYKISRRDSVRLDEYKTAVDHAKFDMEILEPGVTFCTYIVENIYEGQDDSIGDKIAELFFKGNMYFGAKTMRGYGEIGCSSVTKKVFGFDDKKSVEAYIKFDMMTSDDWIPYSGESDSVNCVELGLKLKGGISVRRYTTDINPEEEALNPDYEQLIVTIDGKDIPVIPGTSWAGAFLHRINKLDNKKSTGLQDYFGTVEYGSENNSKNKKVKSKIRFSESQIEGSKPKVLSRNAIDRFSGGTVSGALFTEKTYYGGTTVLKISFDSGVTLKDAAINVLAAAIADLHYGYMPVGGLTAIGRGIFEIETINGNKVQNDNVYNLAIEALEQWREGR